MLKPRPALVATVTAVLLVAGCGESGPLDKKALADKTEAICLEYSPQINALAQPNDVASTKAFFADYIPLAEERRKELDALDPSDDAKALWNSILAIYDEQLASARTAAAALKAGDEKSFAKVAKATSASNDKTDAQLDAFGAVHCGSKSGDA